MKTEDRIKGALIGLACGDAVGTTLEFEVRGSFDPILDMVGGGPFKLDPGQWTDDTSMALCLGHSLAFKKGFDPIDQMNRYCNWYQYGYMSSNGECFDIGITVSSALRSYLETQDPFSGPTDEYSSGNGSIMRLAPIPMFYNEDVEACIYHAGESSRTTHGSLECIESCKMFSSLIFHAFQATHQNEIFDRNSYESTSTSVQKIIKKSFLKLSYDEIRGSGYVIDSLNAALWCFMNTESFAEAILMAANLGDDADTTAAVCGQIAGAFYGMAGIPYAWIEKLAMLDEIEELADTLAKAKPMTLA